MSRSLAILLVFFAVSVEGSPPKTLRGWEYRQARPVELALDAKTNVLVFLSARCPCSASHREVLNQLKTAYPKVRFVGVHSNQDETGSEGIRVFKKGYRFPVLRDADAKIATRFGALKTPHVYVVNQAGQILYQGGVDDSVTPANASKHYLKDALQAISQDQKPDPARTRALGCYIAR